MSANSSAWGARRSQIVLDRQFAKYMVGSSENRRFVPHITLGRAGRKAGKQQHCKERNRGCGFHGPFDRSM
jgi:2'-5' RNA ligase